MPNREFDEFIIKVFFACVPDEKTKTFLHTYQNILENDGLPIQISYEMVDPDDSMCDEGLLNEFKETNIQVD